VTRPGAKWLSSRPRPAGSALLPPASPSRRCARLRARCCARFGGGNARDAVRLNADGRSALLRPDPIQSTAARSRIDLNGRCRRSCGREAQCRRASLAGRLRPQHAANRLSCRRAWFAIKPISTHSARSCRHFGPCRSISVRPLGGCGKWGGRHSAGCAAATAASNSARSSGPRPAMGPVGSADRLTTVQPLATSCPAISSRALTSAE
jgi:hypothetical protein